MSRSELTRDFLSQAEHNLTSPSVSILGNILETPGTDLASPFKDSKENKVVFKKEDYFVDEHEEYCIRRIVPDAQKNETESILLELSPQGGSKELGPHNEEEFGYVLESRITLVNGDKEYLVKRRETFYIDEKYRHYLKSDRRNEAWVLWITAPPLF